MSYHYMYILVLVSASIYLYYLRTSDEKFIAPMTAKIIDTDVLKQYVKYHQQVDAEADARKIAAHTLRRPIEPFKLQDDPDLDFAAKYGLQAAIQHFDTGVGDTKNMNV